MNENLNSVLAELRKRIRLERMTYNETVKNPMMKRYRPVSDTQWNWLYAQARMSYLVPLYRALSAAVQQLPQQKNLQPYQKNLGLQHYQLKFEALKYRMRDVFSTPYREPFVRKYFGHGIENLQLPVPVPGVPVVQWEIKTIQELLADAQVALNKTREEMAKAQARKREQVLAAAAARLKLLRSLNPEQRALLAEAIKPHKYVQIAASDLNELDAS